MYPKTVSGRGRRARWWLSVFAVLAWTAGVHARAGMVGERIPLEDFFRPSLLAEPQLNATGTHLVALADAVDDRRVALLYDLASGVKRVLHGRADRDVYAATWLDERRLLLSQSEGKLYAEGLFVVDVRRPDRAYVVERHSVALVVGVPRRQPLRPVIWLVHDAYNLGSDTGPVVIDASQPLNADEATEAYFGGRVARPESARIVDTFPQLPSGRALAYLADHAGELGYGLTLEKEGEQLYVFRQHRWERSALDLSEYTIVAAGDEPGELWVCGPPGENRPGALLRVDALSGATRATVYQDEAHDCSDAVLIRNPQSGRIKGFRYTGVGAVTIWIDPALAQVQRKIDELLPETMAVVLGMSADEKRWIVGTYSDISPPAYYLLDLAAPTPSLSRLGSGAPWIDATKMRRMQPLHYKARDGASIEGFLTLPDGASKETPAPLIVLPHGGPWVRDRWGWDPEVQFLANRGYAVFQPNYRGSLGSDWRFAPADRNDFLKMHQDVTDGVKKLLRMGLFDPQRVAIMGTSFGGYLALCGVADEPGLYRCAISVAGVFDWALLLDQARSEAGREVQYQWFRSRLGDPREEADKFNAMSPLQRIANVKVPVLVAHGRADTVVDVEQSMRLVAELVRHGVPHEKLITRGEGHGMARLKNRVELYAAIESFLQRNLGQRPARAAAP